ncbi:IMP dehydrogenase / GMP reductase domain protein [secondary endosymbiont of Ctenarytaina eucalypti]|uniref:GMP reductase n=1 Tax=secondary endosymbiont of Ctenarytaina eucalypti TaxID=1199245 RepID=J3VRY6_9ENTR|nr:IMP dehydrogenase / GMP reductase domain protein [secondary endosymbiont of Ctenarytaina eucalypti]
MLGARILSLGNNIVKVGIPPSSVCAMRVKTGVDCPQVSAFMEYADKARGPGGYIVIRRFNESILGSGGGDRLAHEGGGARRLPLNWLVVYARWTIFSAVFVLPIPILRRPT